MRVELGGQDGVGIAHVVEVVLVHHAIVASCFVGYAFLGEKQGGVTGIDGRGGLDDRVVFFEAGNLSRAPTFLGRCQGVGGILDVVAEKRFLETGVVPGVHVFVEHIQLIERGHQPWTSGIGLIITVSQVQGNTAIRTVIRQEPKVQAVGGVVPVVGRGGGMSHFKQAFGIGLVVGWFEHVVEVGVEIHAVHGFVGDQFGRCRLCQGVVSDGFRGGWFEIGGSCKRKTGLQGEGGFLIRTPRLNLAHGQVVDGKVDVVQNDLIEIIDRAALCAEYGASRFLGTQDNTTPLFHNHPVVVSSEEVGLGHLGIANGIVGEASCVCPANGGIAKVDGVVHALPGIVKLGQVGSQVHIAGGLLVVETLLVVKPAVGAPFRHQ